MESVQLIYFSPTHTTKKILKSIGNGCKALRTKETDITFAPFPEAAPCGRSEMVIVGVPVYGGRIPQIVESRLHALKGEGTPAVVVAVYGNRAYEDAMLELRDLLQERGFHVIAGAAFIGEHSYSSSDFPVAVGRPDPADLKEAKTFGEKLALLCESGISSEMTLSIPGNNPYKMRKPSAPITPETEEALCTRCGQCAKVCPTHAIDEANPFATDPQLCIRCAACIKACPAGARSFKDPGMLAMISRLHANCQERKEPELFYPEGH